MSYKFISQKKAGSVLPFSFVLSTFSVVGKEELLSLKLRVTATKGGGTEKKWTTLLKPRIYC